MDVAGINELLSVLNDDYSTLDNILFLFYFLFYYLRPEKLQHIKKKKKEKNHDT